MNRIHDKLPSWLRRNPWASPRDDAPIQNPASFALMLVLVVAFTALAMAVFTSSCAAVAQQPALSWVKAERATYDVVAPRFRAYVEADSSLDPQTKVQLVELLGDWLLRVEAGEKVFDLPPVSIVPVSPAPGGEGGGQ